MREIPLFCDALPSKVVEKIVSHLPLSTVAELMKSENTNLALVAWRRYYSSIKLTFDKLSFEGAHSRIDDEVLSMKVSDFEALVNSDMFDQLRITKLLIKVHTDIEEDVDDFTFLHEKVFTKVSSVVSNVVLEFEANSEWYTVFGWDWLPSSPLVQKCIREISVSHAYIDPDVPSLPSNLRKLDFQHYYQYEFDDDPISPRIVFPPSLQEFYSMIPWGSMSTYANLPSTLKRLKLENVSEFSVKAFNELKLPNLKDLILRDILRMTEVNEHFKFPSLLENLKLAWLKITIFEQRELPPGLQKLSITNCPLKKFHVGTFPNSLKELILENTNLPSSEIHKLKLPSSLRIS
ncbi:hypothetical protein BABINDRAFT_10635 [Babjeviella inositovora NRRL Y-12698]|uniref:F-box domain-containing protein n=1 Tax=Babjeviella inositovora NRRL Y-12698 TaxID=984486 RepID=A0A1E3QGR3_9ASCO|nr:uncharacterized protein BABINDRAFT_10635 [Babjeviella inositovora NRRL Y-12698]ODQ76881.1 hypothetical protein BABINDRAFT_10635 [Babjeviella inositovora NRRL Y-12698]